MALHTDVTEPKEITLFVWTLIFMNIAPFMLTYIPKSSMKKRFNTLGLEFGFDCIARDFSTFAEK